jgi:hypothetical protein
VFLLFGVQQLEWAIPGLLDSRRGTVQAGDAKLRSGMNTEPFKRPLLICTAKKFVMKNIYSLMLSCFVAVSAVAADSAEMQRYRLLLHDQFVIEEPYPVLIEDPMRCCCSLVDRCHHHAVDEQVRRHR